MPKKKDGKRPRKSRDEEIEVVRIYKPEPGALEAALRVVLERRRRAPAEPRSEETPD